MHLIIYIDLLKDHKTLNLKNLDIIKGAGLVLRQTTVHRTAYTLECCFATWRINLLKVNSK